MNEMQVVSIVLLAIGCVGSIRFVWNRVDMEPKESPRVYRGDMLDTVKQNHRMFSNVTRHPIMSGMTYSVMEN
jgi:hypothetical protein